MYVKIFRLKGQIFVWQNYKSNSTIGKIEPAGVEGVPDGEKNRDAHKKGRLSSCLYQKAIIFAHTRQHIRLIGDWAKTHHLGREHSMWVPGVGQESHAEVLGDVLRCWRLVLPRVPGSFGH